MADATPPMAASRMAAEVWPFLRATSPAVMALAIRATWSGPLVASMPNRTMVRFSSPMSTTIGRSESNRLGGRVPGTSGAIGAATSSSGVRDERVAIGEPAAVAGVAAGPRQQGDDGEAGQEDEDGLPRVGVA